MDKLILLLGLGILGCNSSTKATDGGGPDLSMAPRDMLPLVCAGTFSPMGTARFSFRYSPCDLSLTQTSDSETFRIIPLGNVGSMPYMLQLGTVVAGKFKVKHYEMADLALGTDLFVIAQDGMSRYAAEKPEDGSAVTGAISLDVWTLPVQPAGIDQWLDAEMHGHLVATLALDPNTPGSPGDTLILDTTF